MPLDNGNCFKNPCGLKKLEESHVGCELADVPKCSQWEHEILERNTCEHIIDHDSIDVVILDLVKVSYDVRPSSLINNKSKPGSKENVSEEAQVENNVWD